MTELSICIPTFNRCVNLEETLHRCISEIEGGDLKYRIEILVGDNASSDDTENVCLSLKNKYKYINYIKNKENIGGERNWFNLVNSAKGRYVWILCDDDDFLPGLIADIIKIIVNTNYTIINLNYSFFRGVDRNTTFGRALNLTSDFTGVGSELFFNKTNFSSSFTSSNIFNRKDFIENLTLIDSYKGNPWLQLYVVKILLEKKSFYLYTPLKLKMRVLPIEYSRREKHIGGSPHFYFNAHVAFIEFLINLKWIGPEYKKNLIFQQFHQILNERNTWNKLTSCEDYKYWVLMTKKLITLGYFNSSLKFWCRDILLMLLPFFFIRLINNLYKFRYKVGTWVRACNKSQNYLKLAVFYIYSKSKRKAGDHD